MMKKNEVITALKIISDKLGCPSLPGDPNLHNINVKLRDLIETKSEYDNLKDLISDYRAAIQDGYNDYAQEVLKKLISID